MENPRDIAGNAEEEKEEKIMQRFVRNHFNIVLIFRTKAISSKID